MRVLFLCHSHPDLQTGGTEIFARALFRELRDNHGVQGLFAAGTHAQQRPASPGTALQTAREGADSADEVLIWTGGFQPFFQSQTDLYGVMPALAELLHQVRPDVVHVHHLMVLGVETLALIRRVASRAKIVMTLHDYYGMCGNDGQMVTTTGTLCRQASVAACQRCFPDRTMTDLRLRQLHIQAALRQVDRFIAPSQFLAARYAAWGISAERIAHVANGQATVSPAPHRSSFPGAAERRDRFGFFGHINRFKGAMVALEASARLSREGVAHALTLAGGTAYQTDDVITRFNSALKDAPDARHVGAYVGEDIPRLMARVDWVVVPSIWWENAPLVIQEAFAHRRPVICSDIGGMAEAVRNGVDGLHFAAGDPAALEAAMRRAIDDPKLWRRLVGAIETPITISHSAARHMDLYRALLTGRQAPARRPRRKAA